MRHNSYVCSVTLTTLFVSISLLNGAFIVSPTAPSLGNGTGAPFFPTVASFRSQELRPAADFSSLRSPLLITELSWGRHFLSSPIDVTLPNIAIRFSTTTRNPFEISRVFSENVGPDETTVFSGPLHFVDTGGEYGLRVQLQTPFLYDPSQGNLLLEIINYQSIPPPPNGLYVVNYATGPFPTVWFTAANDASATVGNTASNGGMFTRFTVTPVPEPSTWALLVAGVAALTFSRRMWKRNR